MAFERDKDGNVIDPPVIPEYERRTAEATNSADSDLIEQVAEEYNKERERIVKRSERKDGGS